MTVTVIGDLDISKPQPDPKLVEFVRYLYEQAQAGAIQAIAMTIIRDDGSVDDGYAKRNGIQPAILIGGMMCCMTRMANDANEDDLVIFRSSPGPKLV